MIRRLIDCRERAGVGADVARGPRAVPTEGLQCRMALAEIIAAPGFAAQRIARSIKATRSQASAFRSSAARSTAAASRGEAPVSSMAAAQCADASVGIDRAQCSQQVARAGDARRPAAGRASASRVIPKPRVRARGPTTRPGQFQRAATARGAGFAATIGRQVPSATRPARPARWSAEACEIATVSRRVNPELGSRRGSRARPRSITPRIPGRVTLDSATFVASTMRRVPGAAGASAACCSASDRSPCSGTISTCDRGASFSPRLPLNGPGLAPQRAAWDEGWGDAGRLRP